MEEILASIRAIIADDKRAPGALDDERRERATADEPAADAEDDEDDGMPTPQSELLELARIARRIDRDPLLAPETKEQTSDTLAALGAVIVREYEGSERTLEGLVRELLRPMLKDWLDQNLPGIVERMVSREIMRITGK